jgi:6-hydroxycyclohex-1-ene-1-carbonyl-CoA dehydrogenase
MPIMGAKLTSWRMVEPGKPLELAESSIPELEEGQALIEVRACGLCHTDVGFLYGGVRTNAPLPLTLGHEVLGKVVSGTNGLIGKTVIVPAVLPCGNCALCHTGRGNICRDQLMPGNDFDGGFASHLIVPGRYLVPVPPELADRTELAVVGDAVGTAYQSVLRAEVEPDQCLVVIGAGGVGGFAIQVGKLLGAHVIAIDIVPSRLAAIEPWAEMTLDATAMTIWEIRSAILAFERQRGLPVSGRKILECSGSGAGQETAWSLLTYDATLVVVGFTREKISVRLSNLMAFDARVLGNWGCLPEHFPRLLELIADSRIELTQFVETHPMSDLNDLLLHPTERRPILIPDFK